MIDYRQRTMVLGGTTTGRYSRYCSIELFEIELPTLELVEPKPKNAPHGPQPKAKKGKVRRW